ncbi:hypothetical protein GUJ93_ZPchr0007g5276 [Zizania palustris]|uniref:Uncharacterized protein n=1 Tax=Zizania palustris TaxID=103762 RepID=A0A8J5VR75_ZIZPA|nr:hypothetical protein GUJ93_ZPchr0007g5276 [Zizania palustris]
MHVGPHPPARVSAFTDMAPTFLHVPSCTKVAMAAPPTVDSSTSPSSAWRRSRSRTLMSRRRRCRESSTTPRSPRWRPRLGSCCRRSSPRGTSARQRRPHYSSVRVSNYSSDDNEDMAAAVGHSLLHLPVLNLDAPFA